MRQDWLPLRPEPPTGAVGARRIMAFKQYTVFHNPMAAWPRAEERSSKPEGSFGGPRG